MYCIQATSSACSSTIIFYNGTSVINRYQPPLPVTYLIIAGYIPIAASCIPVVGYIPMVVGYDQRWLAINQPSLVDC